MGLRLLLNRLMRECGWSNQSVQSVHSSRKSRSAQLHHHPSRRPASEAKVAIADRMEACAEWALRGGTDHSDHHSISNLQIPAETMVNILDVHPAGLPIRADCLTSRPSESDSSSRSTACQTRTPSSTTDTTLDDRTWPSSTTSAQTRCTPTDSSSPPSSQNGGGASRLSSNAQD